MMSRQFTARPRTALLLRGAYLLLLAASIPFLLWNGVVQHLNAGLEDILLRFRSTASPGSTDGIVLLAIDERTASRYGPLPLNRSLLAAGLRRLSEFSPRVLAVDLLLAEPSGDQTDADLIAAVRRFERPVLGTALAADAEGQVSWIAPFPSLANAASLAHVHADPDADGVVRSILLAKAAGAVRFWALGLEAARLATSTEQPLEASEFVQIGQIRIPAPNDNRQLRINFADREGAFRRVSFVSLLEGEASLVDFTGKIVILGVTAEGSGDRQFTPVSSGMGMSGIEIHANVVQTILEEKFLVPAGAAAQLLAGLLVASACVLAAICFHAWRLFVALAFLAAAVPAACLSSMHIGFILPLGSLLAVYLASAGVAATSEYALVTRALRTAEQQRQSYASRAQAIAHEIKTPLTAIQGSSELMTDSSIPDEQKSQIAGLIFRESKRLTGILRAFLEVEKLAAGDLALRRQPVALHALCAEVLERARLYSVRKEIRIETRLAEITIEADAELLSFAVYNLLTNAVKYSPRGSSILLELAGEPEEVRISVTDCGQGIDPGEQARIFERFYRSPRDRRDSEEGTGIGLALTKDIVEQHGGRILVESEPERGSRFTIAIPRSHE